MSPWNGLPCKNPWDPLPPSPFPNSCGAPMRNVDAGGGGRGRNAEAPDGPRR
uniref:Uncharacterized protein n=1 Tax=Arundo donax TaxID=35708 RepID=A0A0A9N5I5_ARUDO